MSLSSDVNPPAPIGSVGKRADWLSRLREQRVIPVLRCSHHEDAHSTALACAQGGMRVIELTHSTPEVEKALSSLRGEGLLLGVGTITGAGQVESAVAAGADFVVSFTNPPGFVQAARAMGVPAIPGVFTPTEAFTALEEGAAAIKLFPARRLEPSYLADLKPVLGDLQALVTGGIQIEREQMLAWLDAGAIAVGVGSLGTAESLGAQEMARRAAEALELARA